MSKRLRCRAAIWRSGGWSSYQCDRPAKTTRVMWDIGEDATLPVCGIHARPRHPTAYRPNRNMAFASEIVEYMDD